MSCCSEYSTTKKIKFRNKKLAVSNVVLKFLIGVYGICNITINHLYANFEQPTSVVNIWSDDWQPNFTVMRSPIPVTGPEFCDNPIYDVHASAATSFFSASNVSCAIYSPTELLHIAQNKVMVSTFIKTRNFNDLDRIHEKNVFASNAEDVVINFGHFYKTSSIAGGFNPRTRIHSAYTQQVEYDFPANTPIKGLTVRDFLRLANVSLSDYSFQDPEMFNYIRKRMSGVLLSIRMEYSNLRVGEFDTEVICDAHVSVQEGLWGFLGSNIFYDQHHQGVVTVSATNVGMLFIAGGKIGTFDTRNLILDIVSAIVLLRTSTAVVDFIAGKCIREFKQHSTLVQSDVDVQPAQHRLLEDNEAMHKNSLNDPH